MNTAVEREPAVTEGPTVEIVELRGVTIVTLTLPEGMNVLGLSCEGAAQLAHALARASAKALEINTEREPKSRIIVETKH